MCIEIWMKDVHDRNWDGKGGRAGIVFIMGRVTLIIKRVVPVYHKNCI